MIEIDDTASPPQNGSSRAVNLRPNPPKAKEWKKSKIEAALDDDDKDQGRAPTSMTPSRTTAVTASDSTKKEPSSYVPVVVNKRAGAKKNI